MKMNRREFGLGAAAVATVALAPSLGAAQPQYIAWDLARNELSDLTVWELRIWAALRRGERVIYATSTMQKAQQVFNRLKRHKNLYPIAIGGQLAGRGADYIVVDDYMDNASHSMYADWYNCSLRTRLVPGARAIEHIRT